MTQVRLLGQRALKGATCAHLSFDEVRHHDHPTHQSKSDVHAAMQGELEKGREFLKGTEELKQRKKEYGKQLAKGCVHMTLKSGTEEELLTTVLAAQTAIETANKKVEKMSITNAKNKKTSLSTITRDWSDPNTTIEDKSRNSESNNGVHAEFTVRVFNIT
jgi:hypothetical protein